MLFRMTTALVTIVALVVLLGACQGPLGPQGESGQTLDWSDTIDGSNLAEATYAIGLTFPEIGSVIIGSGFSAHYENIIWTNAHVVLTLSEILAHGPPRRIFRRRYFRREKRHGHRWSTHVQGGLERVHNSPGVR